MTTKIFCNRKNMNFKAFLNITIPAIILMVIFGTLVKTGEGSTGDINHEYFSWVDGLMVSFVVISIIGTLIRFSKISYYSSPNMIRYRINDVKEDSISYSMDYMVFTGTDSVLMLAINPFQKMGYGLIAYDGYNTLRKFTITEEERLKIYEEDLKINHKEVDILIQKHILSECEYYSKSVLKKVKTSVYE